MRRMECPEKQRLTDEYFDSLKRQRWIRQRLESIRAEGDMQSIAVAEKQADTATEECYNAWRAMNEHNCDAGCTQR
jgi:hypothetical protein